MNKSSVHCTKYVRNILLASWKNCCCWGYVWKGIWQENMMALEEYFLTGLFRRNGLGKKVRGTRTYLHRWHWTTVIPFFKHWNFDQLSYNSYSTTTRKNHDINLIFHLKKENIRAIFTSPLEPNTSATVVNHFDSQ